MTLKAIFRCGAAAALSVVTLSVPLAPGAAQGVSVARAETGMSLAVGKGMLIRLPQAMTDVFVANQGVADVQVRSSRLLYVYGVGGGETTIYATDAGGRIIYSANVQVLQNIDQINEMLEMTMPGSAIKVDSLNGMTVLRGTVASQEEVEEAGRLVKSFVGKGQRVINKLQTATPAQVHLRVKFAEVSRTLIKELGLNLQTADGGFLFYRGRDFIREAPFGSGAPDTIVTRPDVTNIFGNFGLGGLNVAGMIDALEQDGLISLLAEPNLTALSGETASFLAGGEFPIAVSDGTGGITVQFKEYGVGIAFTPTVLNGGRINLRVRPEVSELTEAGAIRLDNISIPALQTRRAETSIELGSGQSFMIGGLLRNRLGTSADKTPLLGDLPIIGALFRSDRFQRDETELVIVVTPYLVQPTSTRVALPTDQLAAPSDAQRWLFGQTFKGSDKPNLTTNGVAAPVPAAAAPSGGSTVAPGFSND
jgi:pilus assembly protein CpaC